MNIMNIMEEISQIRSCIEILANNIKINKTDQYYVLQLIQNYKLYILEDWIEQCLTSPQTQYRLSGRQFYILEDLII